MKRIVLLLIVLIAAAIVVYMLVKGKDESHPENKDKPLVVNNTSDEFNGSFAKVMSSYYSLTDALTDWDTVRAGHAAEDLIQKVNALPFQVIKADSMVIITGKDLASSMGSELKGFEGENSIEQKRRSFNMLTDELYNLIRTVRYNGEIVYHNKCPMAFGESQEGFWLSNSNKIVNPYLGKNHPSYKDKMIGCGEVVDSLDFTKK